MALLNVERGIIRNRQAGRQIVDYSGLRYGNITPTDIDGFLEFGNRLFVLIELKFMGVPLPYGQQLALERLVTSSDDIPARRAFCLVCEHCTPVDGDIIAHDAIVRAVYGRRAMDESYIWTQPAKKTTARHYIDRLVDKFLGRSFNRG